MVLDLPGDLPFKLQHDVRETAGISGTPIISDFTSSQHDHTNAAAGGTIDHANITSIGTNSHAQVDVHIADSTKHFIEGAIDHTAITNIGSNTHPQIDTFIAAAKVDSAVAGNGIDVSSATGNVTISAEDSTAGNKGIVIVSPGEGIDVGYASGTATISGEDSTGANKGIVIVAGGEGMDVSYSSGTATVSGEDASTSNKGIAKFNTNDFSVSSGDVSLKNKTSYWRTEGLSFVPDDPPAFDYAYDFQTGDLIITTEGGDGFALCPVSLPHGAVVTGAIVYGSNARAWKLFRNTDATVMATANNNTEDTSISNATIDNQNNSYFFQTVVTNAERIYGARITYTTDYI